MQKHKELSIFRVFIVYLMGLLSGVQSALYLFDYYDDGIADIRSALIALVMLVISLVFIIYTFRRTDLSGNV